MTRSVVKLRLFRPVRINNIIVLLILLLLQFRITVIITARACNDYHWVYVFLSRRLLYRKSVSEREWVSGCERARRIKRERTIAKETERVWPATCARRRRARAATVNAPPPCGVVPSPGTRLPVTPPRNREDVEFPHARPSIPVLKWQKNHRTCDNYIIFTTATARTPRTGANKQSAEDVARWITSLPDYRACVNSSPTLPPQIILPATPDRPLPIVPVRTLYVRPRDNRGKPGAGLGDRRPATVPETSEYPVYFTRL